MSLICPYYVLCPLSSTTTLSLSQVSMEGTVYTWGRAHIDGQDRDVLSPLPLSLPRAVGRCRRLPPLPAPESPHATVSCGLFRSALFLCLVLVCVGVCVMFFLVCVGVRWCMLCLPCCALVCVVFSLVCGGVRGCAGPRGWNLRSCSTSLKSRYDGVCVSRARNSSDGALII